MTEETLFHRALEKPPAERAAFLDEACAGDEALRRRVEALLEAHAEPGSFLARPPAELAATSAAQSPVEGAGTRIGPYKLLQKIGEGGMGTVWMAEQQEPVRRLVALKIIKPGMDSAQVIARFEAERQALALMDHPNIAKVLDAGTTDEGGRPYFVMELVKGTPITTYCDEHHLTPRQRLELFVPVCQAVQHAHQKGIIHRDLKPSNVLVAPYDGKPVPKVIDFGIAKATGQRLTERTLFTEFGSVVGTLEYMSPEQAELNNQDIDTRSDIYSLGVLLYELLTGTTPLDRERLRQTAFAEVLRLIREEDPPKPSTRLSRSRPPDGTSPDRPRPAAGAYQADLDWIVMKALEKDRNRRYETATGLARDVERFLRDEPVEACPPSLRYRLRRFVRKHRAAVATVGAVLLTLSAALVAVVLALFEARHQRRHAEAAEARAQSEADRARHEADRARAQAEAADAVARFLRHDLLAPANPDEEPDRDLKVRTLLDRAGARVQDGLAGKPLLEATVRATIGQAYAGLGLYREALPHLERARDLLRGILDRAPPEDGDALSAYLDVAQALADVHVGQGQVPQAVRVLRDLEQLMSQRAQGRGDAQKYLHGMRSMIRAMEDQDARKILARTQQLVRGIGRNVGGKDISSIVDLVTQQQDAMTRMMIGQYAQAEAVLRKALDDVRTAAGEEDRSTAQTRWLLGTACRQQGKHAEAQAHLEKALAVLGRILGAGHPTVAEVRAELAHTLVEQGGFVRAEKLLRESLAAYEKEAPEHAGRFTAQSLLGAALAGQKQFAAAEPELQAGYEGLRARAGKLFPHERAVVAQAGTRLVRLYEAWEKKDQAEAWRKTLAAGDGR